MEYAIYTVRFEHHVSVVFAINGIHAVAAALSAATIQEREQWGAVCCAYAE